MKIVFLVTSARDLMCGVADYTTKLSAALVSAGADATVDYVRDWSPEELKRVKTLYAADRKTVLHLQYPSLFMGNSLTPATLPFQTANLYTTLHEFRIFSLPRKLIFLSHALAARGILFSNDAEKEGFAKLYPFSRRRLHVMPIGNNIEKLETNAPRVERLVYFGQISRNKGIETFIETASNLKRAGMPIECRMIGAMVESDGDFRAMVDKAVAELGIELRLNLPSDAVSRELSEATIALLPFPDGVSDKRGSALACLDHGLSVLTTHASKTPDWLRRTTVPIVGSHDAASAITALVNGLGPRHPAPDVLAREMKARDWRQIARSHLDLYAATMR